MIKKEEVISFVWQHILLLVSLYVMTFGVAACVRSQLGSSVISTIPYVMASAGKMLDYIPGWTIGGYTIMMNAIFVALQILILRRNFEWVQLFQLAIGFIFGMFIDLNMVLTQWMVSENILVNALVQIAGCTILGFGIAMEVKCGSVTMPGVCLEQNHSCFNHHFFIESLIAFICPGPSVSTGKEQAEFLCQAIFQTYSWLDSI